jgi:hypothetical protein
MVKESPKTMVISSASLELFLLFINIEWWAHVKETPEDSKITVLRNGVWNGLKASINRGGQTEPREGVGDRLEWKNAQKKDKKKNTSDTINKAMPNFNIVTTVFECQPSMVLSRTISRHQRRDVNNKLIKLTEIRVKSLVTIIRIRLAVKLKALMDLIIGQGLMVIIWNGWNWVVITCFR